MKKDKIMFLFVLLIMITIFSFSISVAIKIGIAEGLIVAISAYLFTGAMIGFVLAMEGDLTVWNFGKLMATWSFGCLSGKVRDWVMK